MYDVAYYVTELQKALANTAVLSEPASVTPYVESQGYVLVGVAPPWVQALCVLSDRFYNEFKELKNPDGYAMLRMASAVDDYTDALCRVEFKLVTDHFSIHTGWQVYAAED